MLINIFEDPILIFNYNQIILNHLKIILYNQSNGNLKLKITEREVLIKGEGDKYEQFLSDYGNTVIIK